MARANGVKGRTVFVAVLLALLLGALFVLWVVVQVTARLLLLLLVGGLVIIGLLYFGLRRMFAD